MPSVIKPNDRFPAISHGQLHVVAKQFAFIALQTDEHTVYIGMLDAQLLKANRQAHVTEKCFQSGSTCQSHLFQIFGLGYIKTRWANWAIFAGLCSAIKIHPGRGRLQPSRHRGLHYR